MPQLYFRALVPSYTDQQGGERGGAGAGAEIGIGIGGIDTEMKDVSPPSTLSTTTTARPNPPVIDLPLKFDFAFDFGADDLETTSDQELDSLSNGTDTSNLRSPRTPTYQGDAAFDSVSHPPFDVDKFFRFPLISPTHDDNTTLVIDNSQTTPSEQTTTHPKSTLHLNLDLNLNNVDLAITPIEPSPTPPKSPLIWIWTCHICHSRYPLGATRRCLNDGHFYCSGEVDTSGGATQRNVKRKKRGQSCTSEFDYAGWQEWDAWRRDVLGSKRRRLDESVEDSRQCSAGLTGCEGCVYPSQCRYERNGNVPEVVVAASKVKKKSKKDAKGKKTDTATVTSQNSKPSRADDAEAGYRGQDLKLDTSFDEQSNSKSKSRNKDKARVGSGSTDVKKSMLRSKNASSKGGKQKTHAQLTGSNEPSEAMSSPESPDLVDFSTMSVEADTAHASDAIVIENNSEHKRLLEPKAKHAHNSIRAMTLGLPKLSRTKSNRNGG